jgi:hypothetical protein
MTNIIIQALIDSKDVLQSLRQRCSAQELEKIDALCTHLHYLATTTEVVSTLPPAPVELIQRGDHIIGVPGEHIVYEDPLASTKADPRAITEEKLGHPSEAYRGRGGEHVIRWVPEAPGHSGLYAYEPTTPLEKRNCTHNINDALQFKFKQQCVDWCARHPTPKFVPMEHMFMGDLV